MPVLWLALLSLAAAQTQPDPDVTFIALFGKQQSYAIGQQLRARYPQLFSDGFHNDDVLTISSSAERAQMTMQAMLAGVYPPQGAQNWKDGLSWQPIPYRINDEVVRVYKTDCERSRQLWAPIGKDATPDMEDLLSNNEALINYVLSNANFSGDSKISLMADVADNLANMKARGHLSPQWALYPEGVPGKATDITEDILSFAEAHQSAECRHMMAGSWVHHLAETLQRAQDLKFLAYTSHTEVTLSMLYELGVGTDVLKHLHPSGGFILEYKPGPPRIRLLLSEPHSTDPSSRTLTLVRVCSSDWCDLNSYLASLSPISDLHRACSTGLTLTATLLSVGLGLLGVL